MILIDNNEFSRLSFCSLPFLLRPSIIVFSLLSSILWRLHWLWLWLWSLIVYNGPDLAPSSTDQTWFMSHVTGRLQVQHDLTALNGLFHEDRADAAIVSRAMKPLGSLQLPSTFLLYSDAFVMAALHWWRTVIKSLKLVLTCRGIARVLTIQRGMMMNWRGIAPDSLIVGICVLFSLLT